MGIFGKLFKGPEIDQAKSADSKQKMRRLFDSVVPDAAVPAGGRLYGGCEAVQLRPGPRQQDYLRQPDRGLEGGGGPHGGGRAHSSGPLRLRRSGNLPPFRSQKGLSE